MNLEGFMNFVFSLTTISFDVTIATGIGIVAEGTMAEKYKLTYGNYMGLAEPIRFLLAYGKIEYEDYRFPMDLWTTVKPTLPYGKVPIIEINGKVVPQSVAISRYLANKVGLAGKDIWENLQIDAVVDTFGDIRKDYVAYHYDQDEKSKAAKLEVLFNKTVPFYLSRFETVVKDNGGYFVGGKLTWADTNFVCLIDYLESAGKKDLLKDYPNLKALQAKVVAIPQIAEYIAKRPPTPF